MRDQGSQCKGGWVCERPGVSSRGLSARAGGYVRDQGSQCKGGWVCERPAGVSGPGWVGGYVRDQGSQDKGRRACERPGVSGQG